MRIWGKTQNSRADPHSLFCCPPDAEFGAHICSHICRLPSQANHVWQWERIGEFAPEVHSAGKTALQDIPAHSPILPLAGHKGSCVPRAQSSMQAALGFCVAERHQSIYRKHPGMAKVKKITYCDMKMEFTLSEKHKFASRSASALGMSLSLFAILSA